MIKYPVNKFHNLEFEQYNTNKIDRYFNVYLSGRSIKREMIAEIKINLSDKKKSIKKIKKIGHIIHPMALLALDKFMNNYKDD